MQQSFMPFLLKMHGKPGKGVVKGRGEEAGGKGVTQAPDPINCLHKTQMARQIEEDWRAGQTDMDGHGHQTNIHRHMLLCLGTSNNSKNQRTSFVLMSLRLPYGYTLVHIDAHTHICIYNHTSI